MALAPAVLASMWFRGLRLESQQQRADQRFLLGDLFGSSEGVSVNGSCRSAGDVLFWPMSGCPIKREWLRFRARMRR